MCSKRFESVEERRRYYREAARRYRERERQARPREEPIPAGFKRCAKCKDILEHENFAFRKQSPDGFHPRCKPCLRQDKRESYLRNRERIAQRARARYDEQPGYRSAATRAWRAQNGEAHRAYSRAYYQAHPERSLMHVRQRRARLKGAVGTYTSADIVLIYEAQRGRCAYCRADLSGCGHRDHMTPLACGGSNWAWNLCLACEPCNNRKHTRTAGQFFARLIKERRALGRHVGEQVAACAVDDRKSLDVLDDGGLEVPLEI